MFRDLETRARRFEWIPVSWTIHTTLNHSPLR